MKNALANKPEVLLKQPKGITMVRIDPISGLLASPQQKNSIFEFFTDKTVPTTMVSEDQLSTNINEETPDVVDLTDATLF